MTKLIGNCKSCRYFKGEKCLVYTSEGSENTDYKSDYVGKCICYDTQPTKLRRLLEWIIEKASKLFKGNNGTHRRKFWTNV